jgi:hypothetical protein
MTDRSSTVRVLVGGSVFEPATLVWRGDDLHVEFEADDLDDLVIPIGALDRFLERESG